MMFNRCLTETDWRLHTAESSQWLCHAYRYPVSNHVTTIAPQRVWVEPAHQTHFCAVYSPKFANLLMLHHMLKTPIFNIFMIFQNVDSVRIVNFSSLGFLQIQLENFFSEWCTAYSAAAPIAWRTRQLLAPAIVQDTSRQLGVRPCTTLCAFCCGSVTPSQVHYRKTWRHPQNLKYIAYFHVCCPSGFGRGDRAGRLEHFWLTWPSSAVSLLGWIGGVVLSLFWLSYFRFLWTYVEG